MTLRRSLRARNRARREAPGALLSGFDPRSFFGSNPAPLSYDLPAAFRYGTAFRLDATQQSAAVSQAQRNQLNALARSWHSPCTWQMSIPMKVTKEKREVLRTLKARRN